MDTRNPYKTPDGYFEKLSAKILQQTSETDTASSGELFFTHKKEAEKVRYNYRGIMGFAAGFAIMVALAWGGFHLMVGDSAKSVSTEEQYYADELYGIDDSYLYDALMDEDGTTETSLFDAAEEYLALCGLRDIEILLYENE